LGTDVRSVKCRQIESNTLASGETVNYRQGRELNPLKGGFHEKESAITQYVEAGKEKNRSMCGKWAKRKILSQKRSGR